jgi:hypothetical protein
MSTISSHHARRISKKCLRLFPSCVYHMPPLLAELSYWVYWEQAVHNRRCFSLAYNSCILPFWSDCQLPISHAGSEDSTSLLPKSAIGRSLYPIPDTSLVSYCTYLGSVQHYPCGSFLAFRWPLPRRCCPQKCLSTFVTGLPASVRNVIWLAYENVLAIYVIEFYLILCWRKQYEAIKLNLNVS